MGAGHRRPQAELDLPVRRRRDDRRSDHARDDQRQAQQQHEVEHRAGVLDEGSGDQAGQKDDRRQGIGISRRDRVGRGVSGAREYVDLIDVAGIGKPLGELVPLRGDHRGHQREQRQAENEDAKRVALDHALEAEIDDDATRDSHRDEDIAEDAERQRHGDADDDEDR